MSHSRWSLCNGTRQKRPREPNHRLRFEKEEMTLQLQLSVYGWGWHETRVGHSCTQFVTHVHSSWVESTHIHTCQRLSRAQGSYSQNRIRELDLRLRFEFSRNNTPNAVGCTLIWMWSHMNVIPYEWRNNTPNAVGCTLIWMRSHMNVIPYECDPIWLKKRHSKCSRLYSLYVIYGPW